MYIDYGGPGKAYAYACISKEVDGKNIKESQIYLGRVLDKDKNVFRSKERGTFVFDPETGEFRDAPEDALANTLRIHDRRRKELLMLDFGDSFFLDKYMRLKGYTAVLDALPFGNKDTLMAMLQFYTLADLANSDAADWYGGSYASYLYPDSGLDSRRLSEFLEALGREENYRKFFPAQVKFVRGAIDKDLAVLMDSTGLPNSIHFPLTAVSNHNGKISRELRLIAVVQKDTGMPLFFRYTPGNIVDVNTIVRTVHEMGVLDIGIDYCILDAGYYNDLIFDQFAFADIDFMTRVNSGHGIYEKLVNDHAGSLARPENLVRFNDRMLYVKQVPCRVGTKSDVQSYAYICKDISRSFDEDERLFSGIKDDSFNADEIFSRMEQSGLFVILTTRNIHTDEILPAYYTRQQIEQLFDIEKNYSHLVPARVHSEKTLRGHLLLSFMSATLVRMLQIDLGKTEYDPKKLFLNLRNQKCKVYSTQIITAEPVKKVNDYYRKFKITCPPKITFSGKTLAEDLRFVKSNTPKKRGRKKKNKTVD